MALILHLMTTNPLSAPSLMAALDDSGFRGATPRRGITDMIERRGERLPDEEVCDGLPRVGRATAYRTIRLLSKSGERSHPTLIEVLQ